MSAFQINPQYKLLIVYDIIPKTALIHQQFTLNEYMPTLQEMGIYMVNAWHTTYGAYPIRQLEFVLENLDVMRRAMEDPRWQLLEDRMKSYTTSYNRKLVRYRQGFQF